MADYNNEKTQLIVCPQCDGHGKNKLGLPCANCAGMGLGVFYRGIFFYWQKKFSTAVIAAEHLKEKLELGINIAAFVIGLIGLASLGAWAYATAKYSVRLEAFAFWRQKDILILFFWLSILADMFIFYRLSREQSRRQKVKIFKYNERKNITPFANNWKELREGKSSLKVNVAVGLDKAAEKVLEEAYLTAHRLGHKYVTQLHLFYAALSDSEVAAIFTRLNVDAEALVIKLEKQLLRFPVGQSRFSRSLKEVLIRAYIEAGHFGQARLAPRNFLISSLNIDKKIRDILYDLEIDRNKIYNVLTWFNINDKMLSRYREYKRAARFKPAGNMDRAYTAVATPVLEHFSHDLTVAAKWGKLDFCVARDKELTAIFEAFAGGGSGAILTGPDGVGKGTVINGVAQRMVEEDVPEFFMDKRLVELDIARLISGATPAEAEGRMLVVIDEVVRAGNILLYIKNIENIVGITSGGEESLDLSEVLANALERQNLYLFATATNRNYIKYIEGKAISNVLAHIKIREPRGDKAIQIIESKIGYMENKYNVYFSYDAISQAVELTDKYIHDRFLPEKAINFLDLAAVTANKNRGKGAIVSGDDVAMVISEKINIPLTKITTNESDILLNLEEKIHERMVNQEEAVKMVAASLRRARTELREQRRPIANFLFLGPTGVGKTELAKTVAAVYFGSVKNMIRLDMSEYQHPDSVKKMIGTTDGTRGYLTEAVRQSPFSLLLLDELEKAHPDILNLFLQVMDDGRLTDADGRTIDFTNCIIIATSNVGARFIQDEMHNGTDPEEIKTTLINEHLIKAMRPEFINRFDGVIVFSPLSQENVKDITRLMLADIGKMLAQKGINLRLEDEGVKKLATLGFDPKFGARPLRRLLQERVEDKIANLLLAGKLRRRDTVIIDEKAAIKIEKREEL